jgi:phage baseplate assembly protein W
MEQDLMVLRHLVAHDATEADLSTRPRVAATVRPDGTVAGGRVAEVVDLATFADRQNLAQALVLRLLTPLGSLTGLGHAEYGSRLHELIGQPKDSARRNLCRAYVLAAVAAEPRVENEAVALDFDLAAEQVDSFVFTLVVRPVAGGDPLALTLEVGA